MNERLYKALGGVAICTLLHAMGCAGPGVSQGERPSDHGASAAPVATRVTDEAYGWTSTRIMPRSLWDKQMVLHGQPSPMDGASVICVRTVRSDPAALTASATISELRRLQHEAVATRGFADIGCHFYIDRDGGVWAGRSLSLTPVVVPNNNEHTIAVGVLGTGGDNAATQSQQRALTSLLKDLSTFYSISGEAIRVPSEILAAAPRDEQLKAVVHSVRDVGE